MAFIFSLSSLLPRIYCCLNNCCITRTAIEMIMLWLFTNMCKCLRRTFVTTTSKTVIQLIIFRTNSAVVMFIYCANIYLSGNSTKTGVNIGKHTNRCFVYAVIKEESAGITQTICGGYSRFQHIYTSESNSLEIRIVELIQDDGNTPNFVIEYEGMPA